MRPDDRGAPSSLIDELDRTDRLLEAFLLESAQRLSGHDPRACTIKAPGTTNRDPDV